MFGDGHITLPGQRQILVPTTIRRVQDRHLYGWNPIKGEARFQKFGEGTEIVHTEAFCDEHAAIVVPIEMEEVARRTHFHRDGVLARR
ncbi:MAG: hypothetical protein A3I24_04510 [Candidatus Harrisonbacteria bacterium RIFCSPLOWO2_02_FULL_41_13b]|uniref:Uncharacterized protein n=1 Tax=Candidatus Harrisonbacteria bacterium RIFCSPLOWO2_02_FULL_41_13b TaxID=1798409 RepID=A0A1G1ZQ60_9BACT|nr:MAG: hypothetical protein A3J53_02740 [Candidatus Harrisonbacteria bacterium RIFCSPHIGHO2_02_FULL_40_20]OGY66754.1 MAG: hypothetical protein A3I24_04510 [Candidatus Harrisonbacteria bacterium RIFCSPLOWO2_02_FULL_41_13b]